MNKRTKRESKIKLFNPDELAKSIRSAILRDIEPKQLYGIDNIPALKYQEAQYDALTKKYKSSNSDEACREAAISCFLKANDSMCIVNKTLNNTISSFRPAPLHRKHDTLDFKLQVARNWIDGVLKDFSMEEFFDACRHASGTTFGLTYENSSRDAKLRYPLTCTAGVDKLFELYVRYDPQLERALDDINRENHGVKYHVVLGSRTTTVDKNDKTDRTIAIEPTLNMFFQQGLMALMYDRLAVFGLDLSLVPQLHGLLAERYSLSLNGSTIDFSSASDSVSLALAKLLLSAPWFGVLTAVRSKNTLVDGCWSELHMISTMGNATTFPLETLVFASLIVASQAHGSGIPDFEKYRDWSVFGDDCILPTRDAQAFIDLCTLCGFSVNTDKSFFNATSNSKADNFRESCGHDFCDGRNIRPFYLRSPESRSRRGLEAWLYTIWNGCLKKYINYFGNLTYVYGEVFTLLIESLNSLRSLIKIVPDYYPDDSGVKINSDPRFLALLYAKADRLSPLLDDRHGGVKFDYLRFVYDDTNYHNEFARLWDKLKFPPVMLARRIGFSHHLSYVLYSRDSFDNKRLYRTKRKGRYIVASAPSQGWMSKETLGFLYKYQA